MQNVEYRHVSHYSTPAIYPDCLPSLARLRIQKLSPRPTRSDVQVTVEIGRDASQLELDDAKEREAERTISGAAVNKVV